MQPAFIQGCLDLLDEAFAGPADPGRTWVVSNEPHSGLLGTIDAVSAEEASRPPTPGGRTVASHVDHERFALDTARRWLSGEVPNANWEESWRTSTVTEPMWFNLRADLRRAYDELRKTIESKQTWADMDLKGLAATAAHLTYHLGAIRQILKTIRTAAAGGAADAPRCG